MQQAMVAAKMRLPSPTDLYDPEKTVELPAIMNKRRVLLARARRGKRTETGVLRGHSMRCQEKQGFAWVPLIVFACGVAPVAVWAVLHAGAIVSGVGMAIVRRARTGQSQ